MPGHRHPSPAAQGAPQELLWRVHQHYDHEGWRYTATALSMDTAFDVFDRAAHYTATKLLLRDAASGRVPFTNGSPAAGAAPGAGAKWWQMTEMRTYQSLPAGEHPDEAADGGPGDALEI